MTSLLDIGPLTEEVEIRGVKLEVQGLTAGHIFQLFSKFPDMRKLIDTKQGNVQEVILTLAPDLIARIISMALGEAGNKEIEDKAKTMGAGDQMTILAAIQRLSFPDGIGPFVERVTALMTSASTGLPPKGSSPTSSNSTTASPAQFNALLQTDTPANLRGHARRVN
jgi:hypothetical protein